MTVSNASLYKTCSIHKRLDSDACNICGNDSQIIEEIRCQLQVEKEDGEIEQIKVIYLNKKKIFLFHSAQVFGMEMLGLLKAPKDETALQEELESRIDQFVSCDCNKTDSLYAVFIKFK